jgi:hypothetical protein
MRENYPDFLCMKCNAHICCLYFMTSNPGILHKRSVFLQCWAQLNTIQIPWINIFRFLIYGSRKICSANCSPLRVSFLVDQSYHLHANRCPTYSCGLFFQDRSFPGRLAVPCAVTLAVLIPPCRRPVRAPAAAFPAPIPRSLSPQTSTHPTRPLDLLPSTVCDDATGTLNVIRASRPATATPISLI